MSGIFSVVLFVSIIVGICLVIFSLITFNVNANRESGSNDRYLETSNAIKAIDSSIDEIDKALEEMDKTAKAIFGEMDGKYQELLFLYRLLDDKKKEIMNLYSKTSAPSSPMPMSIPIPEAAAMRRYENPRLDKLLELQQSGMSISDIAKAMDMGQGEVKLILELGREDR